MVGENIKKFINETMSIKSILRQTSSRERAFAINIGFPEKEVHKLFNDLKRLLVSSQIRIA
jgi:hypothetical protein